MTRLGKWITLVSIGLIALCVAPALLYIALGPADGNPVGLGLLMVFGGLFFGGTALLGAVLWIIGLFTARRHLGNTGIGDEDPATED